MLVLSSFFFFVSFFFPVFCASAFLTICILVYSCFSARKKPSICNTEAIAHALRPLGQGQRHRVPKGDANGLHKSPTVLLDRHPSEDRVIHIHCVCQVLEELQQLGESGLLPRVDLRRTTQHHEPFVPMTALWVEGNPMIGYDAVPLSCWRNLVTFLRFLLASVVRYICLFLFTILFTIVPADNCFRPNQTVLFNSFNAELPATGPDSMKLDGSTFVKRSALQAAGQGFTEWDRSYVYSRQAAFSSFDVSGACGAVVLRRRRRRIRRPYSLCCTPGDVRVHFAVRRLNPNGVWQLGDNFTIEPLACDESSTSSRLMILAYLRLIWLRPTCSSSARCRDLCNVVSGRKCVADRCCAAATEGASCDHFIHDSPKHLVYARGLRVT